MLRSSSVKLSDRNCLNPDEMPEGLDVKNLKDVKAELLANPAVRQAYDAKAPEFELARELVAARTPAGITQGDVATHMGTKIFGSKSEPAGVQSLE